MLKQQVSSVNGEFVNFDGDEFYKISNFQEMPAFFINLASNSDIWMFLSSNGSLTAGRKNSDRSIFPYETDDRIHLNTSTGPKTIVRVEDGDELKLWSPFDKSPINPYRFTRNLYKNIWGNALVYEEINKCLGLSFFYKWENSERFGIVRTSGIKNLSDTPLNISVLDGVENIIPYGIDNSLQQSSSCLADAYKRAELADTSLAIYSLSSKIVDMPEPVEVLNANVAWSIGSPCAILLSGEQIQGFCRGDNPKSEKLSLGKKCAYFTVQSFKLNKSEEERWMLVLDVCLNQSKLAELQSKLQSDDPSSLRKEITDDIKECTQQLKLLTAGADALQLTNDSMSSKHHFINVLYNNMRGGVFDNGYDYDYNELIKFANLRNKSLLAEHDEFFKRARELTNVIALKQAAYETKNPDLIRICLEFLPICFSRRHGDPSRPWNYFSINLKDENGKRLYHYEGNWRDIFQNWEAMCLSFPNYLENIIAKFLNASTADGYNPYRINQAGIDWEVPEPHNPFSGLGYWGDHQIVYLTKLLEALENHDPSALERFFTADVFCYANVPYRINSYESILKDSKNTIAFDYELHNRLHELTNKNGSDGKLISDGEKVYHCSFMEKLSVPVLAKLANLVVGGGIWMNTQRPEWNDANNAIVGYGLSMVTVYQLRRHLTLLNRMLAGRTENSLEVSNEVWEFADSVCNVMEKHACLLDGGVDGRARKEILDGLGKAFEKYRENVYANGFTGKRTAKYSDFVKLFTVALKYIDYSIDVSEHDKLFNAYNLINLESDTSLSVDELFPMLEGQTAVLGSGKISATKTMELAEAMLQSGLYSPEQSSFYLYPLKTLKTFMEKNIIPHEFANSSKLIAASLKNGDTRLFVKDNQGNIRFNENMVQFKMLSAVMDEISTEPEYRDLVKAEADTMSEIYEQVFKHREFTGRSGIMYKYEGIGCIYWHQNAKFLLSMAEIFYNEYLSGDKESLSHLNELKDMYYKLRKGLGFEKQPDVWGAFPFDPYSHTPYLQGAQQPGMTGQVKEEVLTRRLELGVIVSGGQIRFAPALLRRTEFLAEPSSFAYYDVKGKLREVSLPVDSLCFSLCQVPVVYQLSTENKIICQTSDGAKEYSGLILANEVGSKLFLRDGSIEQLTVMIKEDDLRCEA